MLNRIITLRDTRAAATAKPTAAATGERKENAKAQTRPKGKSPAEYRTEARARDPELAAAHATLGALPGIRAEHADLLDRRSRDRGARSSRATARATPELAAKWIINELPRALGDQRARPPSMPEQLAELLAAIDGGIAGGQRGQGGARRRWCVPASRSASCAPRPRRRSPTSAPTVDAVIAANPEKAAQYKAGKTGLLGFFVGQVMKAAPGADAAAVNRAVRDRLA